MLLVDNAYSMKRSSIKLMKPSKIYYGYEA